jgi:hypothetical protein
MFFIQGKYLHQKTTNPFRKIRFYLVFLVGNSLDRTKITESPPSPSRFWNSFSDCKSRSVVRHHIHSRWRPRSHTVSMASQFTFLTHTNPALGRANTKRMRAHITRKNFEKRRERLEDATCGRTVTPNKILRSKPQLAETETSESAHSAMGYCVLNPYMGLSEPDYVAIHQCKLVLC